MRLASPRKPGNRTARVKLFGETMLTYLRILWHIVTAAYRAARDGDDLGAATARVYPVAGSPGHYESKEPVDKVSSVTVCEDGPGLAKCEPDPSLTDDVCGPHFGVLTCTCQSPLAHPILWRDPGCPVHSRGVVVN